ncbi:hypothetical protein [Streptomyces sp. AC555_RSS877]|uniref:hypothetical protein n=1 Tax=Streptomyces sp. AC555_RSS877 TaxID=2823688 RepID=UPI001C264A52|nr:hypothetical protein [Streptomyces sp. AC555_RSS877]
MEGHGYATVTPVADPTLTGRTFLDMDTAYINRAMNLFPQQGSHGPWTVDQNYALDRARWRTDPVEDPALQFTATQAG